MKIKIIATAQVPYTKTHVSFEAETTPQAIDGAGDRYLHKIATELQRQVNEKVDLEMRMRGIELDANGMRKQTK